MEKQRCNRCKVTLDIDQFKQKRNGSLTKFCIPCLDKEKISRDKQRCEHGRRKSQCRECGTGMCVHNRRKNCCKDCSTGRCVHGQIKNQCKDCETYYCDHGNNKKQCRDCGSGFCIHNKRKTRCEICGGGSLCIHNKEKGNCKECGTYYCEHSKSKYKCIECGKGCIHGTLREKCKICDPVSYLGYSVSKRIRMALQWKTKRTIEYLGCSAQEYAEYIENKFEEDMTWENYGDEWEIDHIIPLKYGDYTEEDIVERLYYTNTQPLWKWQNLEKSNRYIGPYDPDK